MAGTTDGVEHVGCSKVLRRFLDLHPWQLVVTVVVAAREPDALGRCLAMVLEDDLVHGLLWRDRVGRDSQPEVRRGE